MIAWYTACYTLKNCRAELIWSEKYTLLYTVVFLIAEKKKDFIAMKFCSHNIYKYSHCLKCP